MSDNVVYGVVCVVVSYFLFSRLSAKERPPGPKKWPIVGNLPQMPQNHEWLTFTTWAKTFGMIYPAGKHKSYAGLGDCVYLTILGQPLLVLNSYQAANDLLVQKSSIYSSRPRLVMAGELFFVFAERWDWDTYALDLERRCGFAQALALMPYTERFRQMQQLLKKELGSSSLKKYWPSHEEESHLLIKNILANPSQLRDCVRHYSGSIILKITYGYRTAARGDRFLVLAEKVMAAFSEASQPGNWLVDLIPWLRHVPDWMPGTRFKRKAAEWSKLHMEVIEGPYIWAKSHQDSKSLITPNFTTSILADQNESLSEELDSLLLWASASLFGGGADSTVSAISSFFLSMALNPDVQRKAQDEIDSVLQGQRLPRISDLESLPFVENIMREVLRWNPVTPLGVPHLLTEDDIYRTYHIPKGTIVIPNIWLMLHNPDIYPDPQAFKPDRFSHSEQAIKTLGVAYGFGRRACPGIFFAQSSMFIAIATTLSVCNISNPADEHGSPITTNVLYKTGTISHPPKFTCTINCRSEAAMRLFERTVEEEK